MSSARRALGALAVALAGLVAVVVSPVVVVGAEVIPSEDAKTFTITVPIDLAGGEDDIAAKWNKAITDYWNDGPGFGRFKYCGKSVTFKPDIKPVPAGPPGRPDAAKIQMKLVAEGQGFISNVSGLDPTRNSTGTWRHNAPDAVIAHEFGHILGLRDEYVWVPYTDTDSNDRWDPGEPLNDDLNHDGKRNPGEPTHPSPGMEDSIMAGPTGKVLQRHIDAALSAIPGLKCQWKGKASLDHTTSTDGAGTMILLSEMTLKLDEGEGGVLTGSAEVHGTVEFTDDECPPPVVPPVDIQIPVTGTRTEEVIWLYFAEMSLDSTISYPPCGSVDAMTIDYSPWFLLLQGGHPVLRDGDVYRVDGGDSPQWTIVIERDTVSAPVG